MHLFLAFIVRVMVHCKPIPVCFLFPDPSRLRPTLWEDKNEDTLRVLTVTGCRLLLDYVSKITHWNLRSFQIILAIPLTKLFPISQSGMMRNYYADQANLQNHPSITRQV